MSKYPDLNIRIDNGNPVDSNAGRIIERVAELLPADDRDEFTEGAKGLDYSQLQAYVMTWVYVE